MYRKFRAALAGVAFAALAPASAYCGDNASPAAPAINAHSLTKIVPGHTSKSDITALFGKPWRVVQFNDCGEAMDDQADETWEYRSHDAHGGFRLHLEFTDKGVLHLVAKIPDQSPGGEGTTARVAPSTPMPSMSM
jgi:hypothetical protein